MNQSYSNTRRQKLLYKLSILPEKIVKSYDMEHVVAGVLYDLCCIDCFNFTKAAYFIDNPDFNCLRGIAGIDRTEYNHCADIWDEHKELFLQQIHISNFNKMVRSIAKQGSHDLINHHEFFEQLSESILLTNARSQIFPTRHGNRGILLFEYDANETDIIDEYVNSGGALLALCPLI